MRGRRARMTTPDEPLDDDASRPTEPSSTTPTSGTDLGLGPEPRRLGRAGAPAGRRPRAAAPSARPPSRSATGTMMPGVPAAPVVLHPLSDAERSGALDRSGPRRTLGVSAACSSSTASSILACFVGAGALLVARNIRNNIHERRPRTTPAHPPRPSRPIVVAGRHGIDRRQRRRRRNVVPVSTIPGDTTPVTGRERRRRPRRSRLRTPRRRTSSSPAPTTTPASTRTRRTPARSATAKAMGERSDTVMVMRVDPANTRAAILSFPRDLWVRIAGRELEEPDQQRLRPRRSAAASSTPSSTTSASGSTTSSRSTSARSSGSSTQSTASPSRSCSRPGTTTPASTCPCSARAASPSTATMRSRTCDRGTTSTGREREVEGRPGVRPRTRLAAAGLHPARTRRRAGQGRLRARASLAGSIDIATQNIVVDSNLTIDDDARVLRRPARLRAGRDPHVPDRGDAAEHLRQRRARPADQRRQHAVDPAHLPGRRAARRRSRAGVRVDHHDDRADDGRRSTTTTSVGVHDHHRGHPRRPSPDGHDDVVDEGPKENVKGIVPPTPSAEGVPRPSRRVVSVSPITGIRLHRPGPP